MNSSGVRWLMKVVRRAYQISAPTPNGATPSDAWEGGLPNEGRQTFEPFLRDAESIDAATHWQLNDVNLRSGWYMLEIEHSLDSIGCILSVAFDSHQPEYLQLTSKPVCKRIVWLSTTVSRCAVTIDQLGCSISRFGLVALSKSFADRRMRSRLSNRGQTNVVNNIELRTLYAQYQTLVHESVQLKPYIPSELCSAIDDRSSSHSGLEGSDICLIIYAQHVAGACELDESVARAIAFARQKGWKIRVEYGAYVISDSDVGTVEGSTYHLVVLPDSQYSVQAFHQLLKAVTVCSVVVYADHDSIDSEGVRHSPVLKPAWNPELLLNKNYIHLPWMVKDSWLRQLEQADSIPVENFERVLLAAALGVYNNAEGKSFPALIDSQVVRIPKVLASLRVCQPGTDNAVAVDVMYWQRLVRQALSKANTAATVTNGVSAELSRVHWTLPEIQPSVDIIVPTRDQVSVLRACIDSILEKTTYINYRILVVDNDSEQSETEQYYNILSDDARFALYRYSGEFNYSAINNYAVSHSSADVVVLLNNDTEVISPHWLEELVSQAVRPVVGCVGAKLYYTNGRIQHGGVIVGINDVAGHAHRYSRRDARGYCDRLISSQNLTAVTAACLAVRRVTYQVVGGLDEHQLAVAWNDVDFCLKVNRLGLRNVWTPYARLYHHEGLSRGADDTRSKVMRVNRERAVMKERWGLANYNDPAYHPLLTRSNESFGLG